MAEDLSAVSTVINANMAAFDKPGVLSVRPGYKVTKDWLTSTPSVVVTVRHKADQLPAGELLPAEVGGVPVDVRQASPAKALELQDPHQYAAGLRLAPNLGSVPHFPDEVTPAGVHPAAAASAHAQLAAAVTKPELTYSGPAGVTLDPVEAQATITLSASPDSGWPVLKSFLAGTAQTLTVGLYDFTSAHVLAGVTGSLAGKQLDLVLDHPAKNPTADQTDADTVSDLAQALGQDFTQAWALTHTDPDATAWIYPTAYHIKVAVRDRTAFWLSSGNWNNSNQPDIDPVNVPADADRARHGDRDWHVVVEQAQLAGVFEDYIRNDQQVATAHNKTEGAGKPLTPPSLGSSETPAFAQFFPPATVSGVMKIAPLLTPDPGVYAGAVKALIASATRTLYMQFQYIEPPKAGDTTAQPFVDLINAVIDRQQHGVDVKIIMSEFETAGYLEQLQALGIDVVSNVKIQKNVHNKGIVVDGATVLVSSQNWSADGTLWNRDAGVIIYSQDAAQYFQQVFLHDWTHLAATKAASD